MKEKAAQGRAILEEEKDKNLKDRIHAVCVPATPDHTAASAYDEMLKKAVYLGSVSNGRGEPEELTTR